MGRVRISALAVRKSCSIVRTQPTKRLTLSIGSGREGITDLDCTVGHHDTIHQQLKQRTLVCEARASQPLPHTLAECLDVSGQFGHLTVARRIGRKLMLLTLKPGQSGLNLTPPTLVLIKRNDAA